MPSHPDVDTAYFLEHKLAQSIDKVRENVTRSKALKEQIKKLRRDRRQLEAIPDEVKQWFEETAEYTDDEEG